MKKGLGEEKIKQSVKHTIQKRTAKKSNKNIFKVTSIIK